jgi:hypothetical protein
MAARTLHDLPPRSLTLRHGPVVGFATVGSSFEKRDEDSGGDSISVAPGSSIRRLPAAEEATRIVSGSVLRALVDAGDDAPTPSRGSICSPASLDGVRLLYAAGRLEDAMALATEIAEQLADPMPPAPDPPDLSSVIDDIENAAPTLERGTPLPHALRSSVTFRSQTIRPMTVEDALGEAPKVRTSLPPAPLPATVLSLSLTERQSIPRVKTPQSEIPRLPLGPRAGFVLAQIDGVQTIEELLDTCAMSPSEAIEIVHHLVALGIVALDC